MDLEERNKGSGNHDVWGPTRENEVVHSSERKVKGRPGSKLQKCQVCCNERISLIPISLEDHLPLLAKLGKLNQSFRGIDVGLLIRENVTYF